MKLLLISDVESKYLWDYFKPGMLDDIDVIISCGDLNPHYLSFLVTMSHATLYYVHGNHDGRYDTTPPDGCICIDDRIVRHGKLRIMGLGGSQRYNPGPYQYTERQMSRRIRALRWQLFRNRGVDIVVSHAPVRGIGDEAHISHRGFQAFDRLLHRYRPKYWFFGHVHTNYNANKTRIFHVDDTILINACERYRLDIDETFLGALKKTRQASDANQAPQQ